MDGHSLRFAVIVLELISMTLITILAATPARKHAIVNTLLIATIFRSLFNVLPSLIYEAAPNELFITSTTVHPDLNPHTSMARFCVADAIILRYFTVVQAALSVSFTLPCLCLAMQHGRCSSFWSNSIKWQPLLRRYTNEILCIIPFVWALPVLITPIPNLSNGWRSTEPGFTGVVCTMEDYALQIVSLSLIVVPLALTVIIAALFVMALWKYCQLVIVSERDGILHPIRIFRFAALVVAMSLFLSLYSIVLSFWIRDHDHDKDGQTVHQFLFASVVWEIIFPYIVFFIFVAQEEVCDVWIAWYRKTLSLGKWNESLSPHFVPHIPRRPSRILDYLYGPCRRIGTNYTEEHSMHHDAQIYIMPRSYPEEINIPGQDQKAPGTVYTLVSSGAPRNIVTCPMHDPPRAEHSQDRRHPAFPSSLSPPPHAARSRSRNPRDTARTRLTRTMPSLSALASRISANDGHQTSSQTMEKSSDPSVRETDADFS